MCAHIGLRALHGFEIATWIEERSCGTFAIEDGALYHALVRLEERELIDAEWRITEKNRRARYYKLTTRGRRELNSGYPENLNHLGQHICRTRLNRGLNRRTVAGQPARTSRLSRPRRHSA